MEHVVDLVVVI